MSKFSVTRNGEELDPSLYTWDTKTKTFSTDENNLVLNFTNWDGVTFKTGSYCIFKTGHSCTFKTGSNCTFKTSDSCTFDTGYYCTFDTGWSCTFKTGNNCTFDTLSRCTFNTGWGCTFKTGSGCTFDTEEKCVIINRKTNEVIRLNNKENYYDMKEKQVRFEDITVFKNRENINLALQITDLEQLRKLLEDKDLITKLEREVFDKLI